MSIPTNQLKKFLWFIFIEESSAIKKPTKESYKSEYSRNSHQLREEDDKYLEKLAENMRLLEVLSSFKNAYKIHQNFSDCIYLNNLRFLISSPNAQIKILIQRFLSQTPQIKTKKDIKIPPKKKSKPCKKSSPAGS